MKRVSILCLLVLIGLIAGFYQEKLKISINYILDQSQNFPGFFDASSEQKSAWIEANRFDTPFEYYHNHSTIDWLFELNNKELVLLKWLATFVFSLFFFAVNAILLSFSEVGSKVVKLLIWFYLGLALFAYILYAAGILISQQEHYYAISRKLMGALQSMVPAMIMWPAYRLWSQTQEPKPNEII
jgi:hypothetical protein